MGWQQLSNTERRIEGVGKASAMGPFQCICTRLVPRFEVLPTPQLFLAASAAAQRRCSIVKSLREIVPTRILKIMATPSLKGAATAGLPNGANPTDTPQTNNACHENETQLRGIRNWRALPQGRFCADRAPRRPYRHGCRRCSTGSGRVRDAPSAISRSAPHRSSCSFRH